MNYEEYLKCAQKHIKSCKQILNGLNNDDENNKEAYLDIWYLSGYILEGLTVYSVYKTYNWNPHTRDGVKDIQARYDWYFSTRTHLDFYRQRTLRGENVFPPGLIIYSVQGHDFQSIILNLLRNVPTFKDFPILGEGDVDSDVEMLIKEWKPDVRYWHKPEDTGRIPTLSQPLLEKLISTCVELYKRMILV